MSATARPRLASGSRLSAKQNDPTSLQNGNPAFNGVDNHPDCPPSRWTGSEFASTGPPGVAGIVQTPSDSRRRTKTVYHAPNRREHTAKSVGLTTSTMSKRLILLANAFDNVFYPTDLAVTGSKLPLPSKMRRIFCSFRRSLTVLTPTCGAL